MVICVEVFERRLVRRDDVGYFVHTNDAVSLESHFNDNYSRNQSSPLLHSRHLLHRLVEMTADAAAAAAFITSFAYPLPSPIVAHLFNWECVCRETIRSMISPVPRT